MRRKPKDIPQLKPHDKPKKSEQTYVRRQGLSPSQDRFSVQNIKDVTTPQGIAMLNEELRRLRPDKPAEIEEVKPAGGGGGSGRGGTPKKEQPDDSGGGSGEGTKWALTVKHNDEIQGVPKEIQGLDFRDRRVFNTTLLPVIFTIKAKTLEKELMEGLGGLEDRQVEIKADAQLGIISGIIPINKLPMSPAAITDPVVDTWKTNGYGIRPENYHYGWGVYNYIDHGWNLDNPNDFIINIVDLHQLYIRDGLTDLEVDAVLEYVEENASSDTVAEQRKWIEDYFRMADDEGNVNNFYADSKCFEPQVFIPEIEGKRIKERGCDNLVFTKDIIILRGIYKPNNDFYWGGEENTPESDIVDEEEGTVRTNIVYYYTLMRK